MKLNKVIIYLLASLVAGGSLIAATWNYQKSKKDFGSSTEFFYGQHQNGIELQKQAFTTLVAFDLKSGVDKLAVGRMMRVLTEDAHLLTQGKPIIGDPQSEMSENPARLTITFGFGFSLFEKIKLEESWPIKERTLPKFSTDNFENKFNDGDILIQFSGDNPLSLFHAAHVFKKDISPFADVKWQQRGFLDPAGINENKISRNLMGQIDGIANPSNGTKELADVVWQKDGQLINGTTMVVRRIRMNLNTWDLLSPNQKSESVGRDLAQGNLLNKNQVPNAQPGDVMKENAHIKIAQDIKSKILRRGFNYDDGYLDSGIQDAGLIFISYQATVNQFIEVQEALSKNDELNRWITHVGSALFVIPQGAVRGEWIGQSFFS